MVIRHVLWRKNVNLLASEQSEPNVYIATLNEGSTRVFKEGKVEAIGKFQSVSIRAIADGDTVIVVDWTTE